MIQQRPDKKKNQKHKFQSDTLRKYAIYPDYWNHKWGEVPLLGFVYAENAFHASRKAYDKGILRKNITFSAIARLADGTETYNTRHLKRKKINVDKMPMRRPFY